MTASRFAGSATRPAAVAAVHPTCSASPVGEARAPAERPRPLRIRTGHSYHVYFSIVLGQSNARFVERALTPLARGLRFLKWADAVTFTPEPGFDAIHSWNAMPLLTRRPYIVTFEDYLPRTPDDRKIGWLERRLRDRLLSDRCVALIATSDYALRQFRHQHRDFAKLEKLLAKTEVIRPVAPLRRQSPKAHSDRLRLLFVGRDFMRKGGPALLRAHARLRRAGVPVDTTIVSSLQWSPRDYIGPPDEGYVLRALDGMALEGVNHRPELAGGAVRELMDRADYFVLPTFHDTFGFVTIEALAGGTPVVATDTCVMPEIVVPERNGFLLPFENDAAVGKWSWIYRTAEPGYLDAYEAATHNLADALYEQLLGAWERRSSYEALSAGAIATMRDRFDPMTARRRLQSLYEKFRSVS
jgi:glycosyltransferase involved in cell wall biosynthesis